MDYCAATTAAFRPRVRVGRKPAGEIHAMQTVGIFIPDGFQACDHIEESVFPAETLGQHYFVTRPNGPAGSPVPHTVRIYGNDQSTPIVTRTLTTSPGSNTSSGSARGNHSA